MSIEDERLDVLQNIEYVVVLRYREHPELTDRNILRVYEAVIDDYSAKHTGRAPRDWKPEALELKIYDDVVAICEFRLGNQPLESYEDAPAPEPIDMDTLFRCLKRLRGSVQKWIKRFGGRGYLDLIDQFAP